ncbi:MAG: 4Fe-4S dicluster domain-containing protein, partial [Silvania sp.]
MNHFIMANSQQCIGCRACEVACVMAHHDEQHPLNPRHFTPRITVVKEGNRHSAVACHHCENAPCAQSCPNGAIARTRDSVQVDSQKCIGCKACVVACPFGTMEIVTSAEAATAQKCDLCLDRPQGPACVENCPADALSRVTPDSLNQLARTRRLRTARHEAQPWQTRAGISPVGISKREQMSALPPRGEPDKLSPAARANNFAEIYLPFRPEQAHREAERCLKCGEHSVCEWTCPLHNPIPQWIELVLA